MPRPAKGDSPRALVWCAPVKQYTYSKEALKALVSASAGLSAQTKCPHPASVPRNQCFPQSLQHWEVVEAQCRRFPGTHLGSKEARRKEFRFLRTKRPK